jgi:hypothetical protein
MPVSKGYTNLQQIEPFLAIGLVLEAFNFGFHTKTSAAFH